MRLTALGWDEPLASAFDALSFDADVEPARVVIEFNYLYRVWTATETSTRPVRAGLKHHAGSQSDLPAVGDWVVIRHRPDQDKAAIVAVLPRRSAFSRKMAGR